MLFGNGRLIMERAALLGLPAIFQFAEMAEESGFAAYGPRVADILKIIGGRLSRSSAGPRSPTFRSSSRRSLSSW